MTGLVALTGATGFLGQRLTPVLLARGWRVRALARRVPQGPPPPGLDWIQGDLADARALAELARGAEAFVHLAGLIMARDLGAFLAANAQGAAAAAAAARGAGARLVHISSLAAREPHLSPYAASKRAGEDAARAAFGAGAVILRPPAVYGPGDRATLGLFQLAARSPILPCPADPDARLALIHADDAAAEIAEAVTAGGALALDGGVFALGGARPEGYGWSEIWSAALNAFSRRALVPPLPLSLIHAAGALADLGVAFTGRPSLFGRGKARELAHRDWSVAPEEMAPWQGRGQGRGQGQGPGRNRVAARPLDQGFAETARWYAEQGWL
jgi:nucleoside-diphosphate-sugar epimerase